jgi:hypothetical protein
MPAPPPWRYRCYATLIEVGGNLVRRDEIRVGYQQQSKRWRAKFAERLSSLQALPFAEWRWPLFRWLSDDGRGLGEVRFLADGVQQRPLGFRGPEPDVFTLVFLAQERSNKFVPRNAIETAQRLRERIEANDRHSIKCWLFSDS